MSGFLIAGTLFHLHVAALDAADAPVFCKSAIISASTRSTKTG
jgi:hypothetical protein